MLHPDIQVEVRQRHPQVLRIQQGEHGVGRQMAVAPTQRCGEPPDLPRMVRLGNLGRGPVDEQWQAMSSGQSAVS